MRVIEKTSWSASSDVSVLPVIPCFVLDTTATEFWYVTTSGSTKVSGGGGAVSGVKGNSESTYRTGNVNLTPANIGALALSGGTVTGMINRAFTSGVSYIGSWADNAPLIRLTKTEGSSLWRPILALRTHGGGGWAIGNYDDETLEFVYGTKANIESSTNTTTQIYFTSAGGANFPGTIQQNGTNVSLSGHTHTTANITNLGTVVNGTAITSDVTNAAYISVKSLTLAAGKWVIEGGISYNANATGQRWAILTNAGKNTAPSSAEQAGWCSKVDACASGVTVVHAGAVANLSAQTTFYLTAYQNSGATRTGTSYVRAIRIA